MTSEGEARARVTLPDASAAVGTLILGHGAGGGVDAPDIRVAARAALAAGWAVALVEQPYRVAGRRSPVPAPRLDTAWIEVASALGVTGIGAGPALGRAGVDGSGNTGPLAGRPLVCGGRSSGARVACRTAGATGAVGVLCLAFPLRPPVPNATTLKPRPSRQPELDGAGVPMLVVQGRNDRFGMPRSSSTLRREVVRVEGDHGLKRDHAAIAAAVTRWLTAIA